MARPTSNASHGGWAPSGKKEKDIPKNPHTHIQTHTEREGRKHTLGTAETRAKALEKRSEKPPPGLQSSPGRLSVHRRAAEGIDGAVVRNAVQLPPCPPPHKHPPPPPLYKLRQCNTIAPVPTPTVPWTRAWLARNTYNCRHTLKSANVTTNPCLMRPHYISYVIELRTQLLRSLRLLRLGQGPHTHGVRRSGAQRKPSTGRTNSSSGRRPPPFGQDAAQ